VNFYDVVDQVVEQLKKRGRVSYRALQLEFDLSAEQLDTLKEELIDIQEVAIDRDGKMLTWIGGGASTPTSPKPQSLTPNAQFPASYTPQHLPERIRTHPGGTSGDGVSRQCRRRAQNHHGPVC
jgi:hypothetical protein